MSRHLFPIKLHQLISKLITTEVWKNKQLPLEHMPEDDGLTRIILHSSEVVSSVSGTLTHKDNYFRLRLAVPSKGDLMDTSRKTRLEIYNIHGKLMSSFPIDSNLPKTVDLAIEVELLTDLLESMDNRITMM